LPTYLGWNVIAIPSYPPAPASVQFVANDAVGISISPFTGNQQTYYWNPLPMEVEVSMPAMPYAVAQSWVTFMRNLQGQLNVFQFTVAFMAAYPGDLGTRYWRLKSNARQWSIDEMRMYGLHFGCREAM
jgi:hypothetical protein